MKKIVLFCLAIGMSLALCACGQGKGEESAQETEMQSGQELPESASSESVPAQDDPVPTSYLTGLECTEEEREQRPLAIMLNNLEAGCPQAGIAQASVIYEAPMEKASVTRLMPLFENWEDLEYIGYVRSARDYFVYSALEFDAIFAHFGQATVYTGDLINGDEVDNISAAVAGIDRPATKAFMRTDERKAPHNVYTTGQDLMDAAEKFQYSLTYHDTHKQKFAFAPYGEDADHADAPEATVLYPGGKETGVANGYSNVQARFEYNEEDGKYYRYQYGGEHIDELTGEQLAVDNVIFQYCHGEFRDDEGYMAFECHGGWQEGDAESGNFRAQVFTGGKMIEGTWSRYADTDPALYVDEDGNPIELNRGKTWICIIWDEHADGVVIE